MNDGWTDGQRTALELAGVPVENSGGQLYQVAVESSDVMEDARPDIGIGEEVIIPNPRINRGWWWVLALAVGWHAWKGAA